MIGLSAFGFRNSLRAYVYVIEEEAMFVLTIDISNDIIIA